MKKYNSNRPRFFSKFTLFRRAVPIMLVVALALTGCVPPQAGSSQRTTSASPPRSEPGVPVDPGFVADGYYEKIPKLPKAGYFLKQLADEVYFFSTGAYNTLFIATSSGVVLIDPIRNKGEMILRAIQSVTSQPVKFLIYSNPFLQRIGDAYLFSKSAQIVAHGETRALLERYRDSNRPVPNISFTGKYNLNFGDHKIQLIYPGEGAGKGNIMIYLAKEKILMYAEVAPPKSVPMKNFGAIDIFSQMSGLRQAQQLRFDTYVAGRFHRPGTRAEFLEILDYYEASKKANAEAIRQVTFRNVVGQTQSRDIERIIGEYYETVAEKCYQILKKDWKRRLMGFEAFARGHCDVWTQYHRNHQAPP